MEVSQSAYCTYYVQMQAVDKQLSKGWIEERKGTDRRSVNGVVKRESLQRRRVAKVGLYHDIDAEDVQITRRLASVMPSL